METAGGAVAARHRPSTLSWSAYSMRIRDLRGTASGLRLVFAKRKVVVLFNGKKSQCRIQDFVWWSLPSLLFFSSAVELVASSSQKSRSRPSASNTQVFRDHIVRNYWFRYTAIPRTTNGSQRRRKPCALAGFSLPCLPPNGSALLRSTDALRLSAETLAQVKMVNHPDWKTECDAQALAYSV